MRPFQTLSFGHLTSVCALSLRGASRLNRLLRVIPVVVPLLVGLAACDDDNTAATPPAAVFPTRDAMTYFGHMILVDHQGPKAQIHLKSKAEPLWFPSVRDAKAFTLLPGEPRDITAIYVTDMAQSANWDHPATWVPAKGLSYVIGSDRRGGMGAPEAVPFSDKGAATQFMHDHGGTLVAWADIPQDYVLGEAPEPATPPATPPTASSGSALPPMDHSTHTMQEH